MNLPFFSRAFVKQLKEHAALNIQRYSTGDAWIDELNAEAYIRASDQVVDPPPQLVISGPESSRDDAENAKRVFTWLRALTPALAMEERLWSYLCHCTFPAYMTARWPSKDASTIHRRYFFEGASFAALSRNGIARLWWAGYLTFDETRANPFELTEILFQRQDTQVALLERSLGKCRSVRIGMLEFLRDNAEWLSKGAYSRRIQILARELNLLGGVIVLDALSPEQIKAILDRLARRLVDQPALEGAVA